MVGTKVNIRINQGDPHAVSVRAHITGNTESSYIDLISGQERNFQVGDDGEGNNRSLILERVHKYGDNIFITVVSEGSPGIVLDLDNKPDSKTVEAGKSVKLPHGRYRNIIIREVATDGE